MPNDSKILGFSNRWYLLGFDKSINIKIAENISIKILSIEYFLASKFEAYFNRGSEDIRFSKDFSDIVYILNNRENLYNEIKISELNVREFIVNSFKRVLLEDSLDEAIEISIPRGYKIDNIIDVIKKITRINQNDSQF